MSDLKQELRDFEGSDALGVGDFSVCLRAAARIAEMEAAQNRLLEILDEARNGLCNCDRGTMSSSQVKEEIRAALEGGKDE